MNDIPAGWRLMVPGEVATTEDMVEIGGTWVQVCGLAGAKAENEHWSEAFIRKDNTPKPDPEWLNPWD